MSLFDEIRPVLQQIDIPIYLVGGAVRDALAGVESNDLDFAVERDGIRTAFRVGNALGVPAYPMDEERDVGRVMLKDANTTLDFARYRAGSLEADLRDRDFTVNAIGMGLDGSLVDPTGGVDDLTNRVVRQTHSAAIQNDPVRGLRAIRLAVGYRCIMEPETAVQVRKSADWLERSSAERNRDAFLKLISLPRPDQAIRQLLQYGLLHALLPEIAALESLAQGDPHFERVLDHTISVLHWLPQIEVRYQDEPILAEHFGRAVDGDVTGWQLLRLGALFHDVGKTATRMVENGKIEYFDHEAVGSKVAAKRLRALKFSREAVQHVAKAVGGHGRPSALSHERKVSGRATYRFFNALGSAGLDACLISLADNASFRVRLDDPDGMDDIECTVDKLLQRYVKEYDKVIAPPPLVKGEDVIALGVPPGREIGRLLALVRENQAAGEITTREDALTFIRENMNV